MEKTLLEKFIFDKVKSYIEPQRKGIPKGDPIGFSKEKYKVSLYMLYGLKQKELARSLNISYGLLRKWNTEKVFKNAVKEHYIEYPEYILRYLRTQKSRMSQQYDETLQKRINETYSYQRPRWNFEEFKDYNYYNPILRSKITNYFNGATKEAIKTDDLVFLVILYGVSDKFRHFSGGRMTEEEVQADNRIKKMIEKELLKRVKDILIKKTISGNDKKQAMYFLSLLEQKRD